MTAFDNIKTNNWPATSNEFEDFLVFKAALNDNASLTESLPVVAGSQKLFPKRTLTNTGVSALTAGPIYSDTLTVSAAHPNNTSPTAGFDGNTATSHIGGVGATATWDARTYSFPPNSTVEVYSYTSGGERSWAVDTGSGYGSEISEVAGWQNLGTYSNIQYIRNSSDASAGYGPGFGAIRINGTVLVDAPGGPKKHYNNNVDFGTTSQDKHLTVPASSGFQFGNAPWCIECWAYIRSAPTNGSAIWDFNTSAGFQGYEDWICAYYQGSNVWFYWGSSNYDGIYASFTANQWQHWAWTWDGTTARLFRDGTLAASTTTTNKSAGWGSATRAMTIGKQNYDSPNRFGDLQVQDLRVYKGVAKYTSNFTPPPAILD